MEFWVQAGHLHPHELTAIVSVVEELGFDGLALPDHLTVPADMSSYPYSADGKPPFAPEVPWNDVWVAFAALSMLTERLQFMSSVYILPLRHPLVVSRAVATASAFSGGRVRLGVGVGWLEEEYAAVEVSFRERGRLADEGITALRASWEPGPSTFRGEYYSFGPTVLEPRPPAPVPIFVGGTSASAIRRAVRLGDGYLAPSDSMAAITDLLARIRRESEELRTDRPPVPVHARLLDATTPEDYLALAEQGLAGTAVLLPPGATLREHTEVLETFAQQVLRPVRSQRAQS